MLPSAAATAAQTVIAALKADMAAGVIPANTKSLDQLDAGHYLGQYAGNAVVTRFVNVWLGAKR